MLSLLLTTIALTFVVIGNEILKGEIQDTNTNFLCKKLWSLGVKVKKVSFGIQQQQQLFMSSYVLYCSGHAICLKNFDTSIL